jgi:peptidyl-prolyl cis-trans isomerase D
LEAHNTTKPSFNADVTVDNPVLPNVGMEGKVVELLWNCNKVSAPIEGVSGVYVVKTKSVTKAAKS